MKTIAFFNIKGGVGKTTSAVNIAALAAQHQVRTVLWDLDPQSSASWYLGNDDDADSKAIRIFKGKEPIGHLKITTPIPNLQLIPADVSLRKLEVLLGDETRSRKFLSQLAEHLGEKNKLLIFDCPPGLSTLAENVFTCSDLLMVPLIPSPLSLRAFAQLQQFIRSKKQWRKLSLLPFFTLVDMRRKIHRETLEAAPGILGIEPIVIPNASDLEKMGITRQPIFNFAGKSPSALAYEKLWDVMTEKYELL